ncbi:hypothetical protein ES332_A07G125100v1 [Gossypium tomentosum]|uniref:Glycosyltransferase N-terminal domain-containing protein n=1 Tax=Gossypium tomentosum TaxID=34277 RepID=A0A5D2PS85_GOSTO|nr:hypothetical protein ES332_A07G125100v1 [Gossypium tomentosum]
MEFQQQNLSILMLPWLAEGHISPYLQLAKKLSARNFIIYFCLTPINLDSIRKSGNVQVEPSSIQLIYLHLPSPSQLPPQHHTTRSLPPHLFPFLIPAFDAAKPNFSNILSTFKPNLVIYDFLQPWAAAAANEQDVESVMFLTTGADGISSAVHYFKNPNVEHSIQEAELKKYLLQWFGGIENGVRNKDRFLECLERSSNMVLINTSRMIEAQYIDYVSVLMGKQTVPVGPLVQECGNREEDVHIMEWLGKKEPGSVVLVSFRSDLFISKEDMEEIAMRLELSKICFIWAVRFQGGYNTALLEGFSKRFEERGLMVQRWVPQAKILSHSSIGGFVSHCGWNSTLEGIINGVPIIAMPIKNDQPFNAKVVTELQKWWEMQLAPKEKK